ncbi:MAG TPA: hypothetical protein VLT33_05330 [Labilithrix sp.]|nr:hypothetical protein [Labilithrix sp.]
MSAIAPPPVGSEAEPSVIADNANACAALRGARGRELGARPPWGLLVLALVAGVVAALAATVGARVNMRKRNERWYRR